MPRLVAAVSIGLTLVLAFMFGMIGWRLAMFSPPLPSSETTSLEVGVAFYAELGRVLSIGPPAEIGDIEGTPRPTERIPIPRE